MITKLMTIFLVTAFTASAIATETCAVCGNKDVQGMPKVDSKLLNVLEAKAVTDPLELPPVVVNPGKNERIPFEDYQMGFCMQYTQINDNKLTLYVQDLESATPYYIDDYLQRTGCKIDGYNGSVRAPLLHRGADDIMGSINYLQYFYKYYSKKRKDPSLFVKAINAKNTNGETFLDYVEHEMKRGKYATQAAVDAANRIIEFACSVGAVYSKYDKKCP